MTEFAMIIGGTRVRAASEFDVMNPSTGKLIAKAPNASAQDLDRAVAAATSALNCGPSERMRSVRRHAWTLLEKLVSMLKSWLSC